MLSSERRIEVVVVDDHPFFRDGVSRGLTNSGLITVVAEAENGRDGLAAIAEHRPQVAVVDYQMPDLDGIAVTQAVVRDGLPTKVLLLSAITDSPVVFRALEVGASGYLSKDARRAEIVDAVLSERELQVLKGFARGLSIPQLAKELFIGASTVKTHTQRLYEKLGVSDRAAAVAEGMRRGLLE